jgi:hypothetical protein
VLLIYTGNTHITEYDPEEKLRHHKCYVAIFLSNIEAVIEHNDMHFSNIFCERPTISLNAGVLHINGTTRDLHENKLKHFCKLLLRRNDCATACKYIPCWNLCNYELF